MSRTVLITGIAGFIGFSLAKYLVDNTDYSVVGIDNINTYYDTTLKHDRLAILGDRISFYKRDLNDDLEDIFKEHSVDNVVNLAAQAGVRYSKTNPDTYIASNINGFYNLLRSSQKFGVKKVIYASSSSVYGANIKLPFSELDAVNTPMSLYAATKVSNENIASGFYYSYGMRTIGLRFFNIYGPYGRPDMAYYKWTQDLISNRKIYLNNNGDMWRDMTYIDDCTAAIHGLLEDSKNESSPEVYNVGNKDPVRIGDLLSYLSDTLKIEPSIEYSEAGREEPLKTWADTSKLEGKIGFAPSTNFRYGVSEFLKWHSAYYN